MKNILASIAVCLLLASCGGSTNPEENKKGEASTEISKEEESVIVNEVVQEVQADISEIKNDTEEGLQEVDSLLNNL